MHARRRFLAPEVIQTSGMDCGPAALKCLLDGHGVPVSYGRLREACQTDVDGTSIDRLEELACALGLEASQVCVPVDHVLLPEAEALPAIAVVLQPSGLTHFVVLWRRLGAYVQVMDPGGGRRWRRAEDVQRDLYCHRMRVPADAYAQWLHSDGFTRPLAARLRALALRPAAADRLLGRARALPGHRGLIALDGATRMLASLASAGCVPSGAARSRLLEATFERVLTESDAQPEAASSAVPQRYRSAFRDPADAATTDADAPPAELWMRGAVLLTVRGVDHARVAAARAGQASFRHEGEPLPLELVQALRDGGERPLRALWSLVGGEGLGSVALLGCALAAAGLGVLLEALVMRALVDATPLLALREQRLGASFAVVSLALTVGLLELGSVALATRLGRRLEAQLRLAFLRKVPRLLDAYFRSRPLSDMAHRAHASQLMRVGPVVLAGVGRALIGLAATTLGLCWLSPSSAPLALAAAGACVLVPAVSQRFLREGELRQRSHAAALSGSVLDTLLGLTAIRAHGAQTAVRREHEARLVEHTRAARALATQSVLAQALLALATTGCTIALVLGFVGGATHVAQLLLFVHWALSLPALGAELARGLEQVPALRNVALRLIEPLQAEEVAPSAAHPDAGAERRAAAALSLRNLRVVAGGHPILQDVALEVPAGQHVAIVGASGAGKSSLLGVLLGWHRPTAGEVRVDGAALDLERLRAETVWVDPSVQLWNRSLLDNVGYGAGDEASPARLAAAVQSAELRPLLERLPEGLATEVGESGRKLSGGEGQRLRLARGLARQAPRLVLLDEPFRGLDHDTRSRLASVVRMRFRSSTLLCVTHDVAATRGFDRVLVIDDGRIVEDGAPAELAQSEGSRYRALLDAEHGVRERLTSGLTFRRLRMEGGTLVELSPRERARQHATTTTGHRA